LRDTPAEQLQRREDKLMNQFLNGRTEGPMTDQTSLEGFDQLMTTPQPREEIMPEDRRNAFMGGVFFLLALAPFFLVFLLVPPYLFGGPRYPLVVRFPQRYPLPPLDKGSAVVVGGQKVGTVSGVSIDAQPPAPTTSASQPVSASLYIVVHADVGENVVLRTDARAR